MTEKDFEGANQIKIIIGSCEDVIKGIREIDDYSSDYQFKCLGEDVYFALQDNPKLEKAFIRMLEEEIQYREEELKAL